MSRSDVRCLPQGICSWSFALTGRDHEAIVELRFTDRGRIVIDGQHELVVTRTSLLSRRWTVEGPDGAEASAEKLPFRRHYEITTFEGGALTLQPASFASRSFVVRQRNKELATITPDHLFTRRATIAIHRQDSSSRRSASPSG